MICRITADAGLLKILQKNQPSPDVHGPEFALNFVLTVVMRRRLTMKSGTESYRRRACPFRPT